MIKAPINHFSIDVLITRAETQSPAECERKMKLHKNISDDQICPETVVLIQKALLDRCTALSAGYIQPEAIKEDAHSVFSAFAL